MPETPLAESPLLEVRGLRKRFGSASGWAVDSVDLTLARGETLGLVGESGCGKSTLARCALRLVRPNAGRVLLDGVEVWPELAGEGGLFSGWARGRGARRELRRLAQMVFQDPYASLNPRKAIGWSVAEGLRARGVAGPELQARTLEALEWVGLSSSHAGRYPHEFSGGQRQRAAIARALAPGPELLICDEPVSGLDVSIRAQVLNLLADLRRAQGFAMLFISHDLAVVRHVADRVAVMYLGRIVELASREALFARPLHPYARTLLAAAPVPDPTKRLTVPAAPKAISGPMSVTGCAFAPRCPEVMDACLTGRPELREVEPGHFAACIRA